MAADAARPFTVTANEGSTTALGTRFLVRRLGNDTDITVTEHSVRVAVPDRDVTVRTMTVREGQAARYGADGMVRPHAVDIGMATAWMRGRLMFVDSPLEDVVAELNRYHVGYIGVVGNDLAQRRFSGVLPIADPVAALDTIEQSLGISSVRITDRLIFLHG